MQSPSGAERESHRVVHRSRRSATRRGDSAIYQFVDDLVASGISASVVHQEPGFRCRWFASNTPVTWMDDVVLGMGDVLVVPEISVTSVAELSPGTPMVVLNQNPYLTFHNAGLPPTRPPVLPDNVVSIVTASEDACDYLGLTFPGPGSSASTTASTPGFLRRLTPPRSGRSPTCRADVSSISCRCCASWSVEECWTAGDSIPSTG